MVSFCECNINLLGSIRDGQFLDQMKDSKLLKKGCSMELIYVQIT
jgi:hypothetical protein